MISLNYLGLLWEITYLGMQTGSVTKFGTGELPTKMGIALAITATRISVLRREFHGETEGPIRFVDFPPAAEATLRSALDRVASPAS